MQREADYAEAIVTKYPEQVVVAIARDAKGKYNPITLGWTMIASGSPPMMAVANGNRPLVVVNNTGRVPSAPLAEGGEGQMANAYGAGKQP